MAKKSKSRRKSKQRKPNVPVYSVPTESQEAVSDQAAPTAVVAPQAVAAPAQLTGDASLDTIDWRKEYPFFAPDMKRLAIVVAIMVVLLLALNIVFIYLL